MEREGVAIDDLVDRYLKRYVANYVWDGMPDDMPEGYVEDRLFWQGNVSAKNVKGLGPAVMAASPTSVSLYGTPLKWLPSGIYGNVAVPTLAGINKESDNPVISVGSSPYSMIEPYIEIMRKAMNALNLNVAAEPCLPRSWTSRPRITPSTSLVSSMTWTPRS